MAHATGLVLDEADRGGRVRHEDAHETVRNPRGVDHLLDAGSYVDDVAVSLGRDSNLGAVDRHRRRNPTAWMAAPSVYQSSVSAISQGLPGATISRKRSSSSESMR